MFYSLLMERKGAAAFADVVIDFDRMEILRGGHVVPATSLEFRLLKFFVDNPEYVFSREELIRAVWPARRRVNGRTVDNYISHLRQKLERDPAAPAFFQTVYGTGYKFVPNSATAHVSIAQTISL
jgi:DNA-binding response OmpR family regulator